jgi:alpha-1,3/alpha-1,6-mannosyltransferase
VKRLTGRPVLYYCHFPDMLLARPGPGRSPGFNLYRQPLDALEVRGIAAADAVVANSHFTASMLLECVPALRAAQLHVVHPGVCVPDRSRDDSTDTRTPEILLSSISRFDPRKNLDLAIEALAALKRRIPDDLFARIRLVLAGHLDHTLPEACRVVDDLRLLAESRGVQGCVRFVFSPTDGELEALLKASSCVLYTPEAEHFGYVPLEAMAAGRPVVAVNRGGPVETVVHDVTGLLCDPAPEAFADALARLVADPPLATRLGRAARVHVASNFSLDSFGARLWSITRELLEPQGSRVSWSARAT